MMSLINETKQNSGKLFICCFDVDGLSSFLQKLCMFFYFYLKLKMMKRVNEEEEEDGVQKDRW